MCVCVWGVGCSSIKQIYFSTFIFEMVQNKLWVVAQNVSSYCHTGSYKLKKAGQPGVVVGAYNRRTWKAKAVDHDFGPSWATQSDLVQKEGSINLHSCHLSSVRQVGWPLSQSYGYFAPLSWDLMLTESCIQQKAGVANCPGSSFLNSWLHTGNQVLFGVQLEQGTAANCTLNTAFHMGQGFRVGPQ